MARYAEPFIWSVPSQGYRWVESRTIDDPEPQAFLTDAITAGRGAKVRLYAPLEEHSGLVRNFADVEPTPDEILAFANRYGCLGGSASEIIPLDGGVAPGERALSWSRNIYRLRHLVDLHRAIQEDDQEALTSRIRWEEGRVIYAVEGEDAWLPLSLSVIATSSGAPRGLFETFRHGDTLQPALHHLATGISAGLREDVATELVLDPKTGKRRIEPVPRGLLGAMWLQLAHVFQSDQTFRRCDACGTWYALARNKEKLDRGYCSNACRSRAYKGRQSRAVELGAEGHSVEQIATELAADPAAVAGWIARATYEETQSP
jgi:hypothetical protein